MKHDIIETDRLIIRPLLPDDKDGMFLLDSDPDVHRYVGRKPVKTIEESIAVIELIRKQYENLGIGRWAVLEKGTNDFVGWTGFKFMTERINGYEDFYDFGYRLRKNHWGKGYATESGGAILNYGLTNLGYKDVYAMTDVENRASRHVLEKLGFSFIEIFNFDGVNGWRELDEPATWYQYTGNKKQP